MNSSGKLNTVTELLQIVHLISHKTLTVIPNEPRCIFSNPMARTQSAIPVKQHSVIKLHRPEITFFFNEPRSIFSNPIANTQSASPVNHKHQHTKCSCCHNTIHPVQLPMLQFWGKNKSVHLNFSICIVYFLQLKQLYAVLKY